MPYYTATMDNDMTFEHWMSKVDFYIDEMIGMSSYDLPDIDYYSLYDSGCTPRRAAQKAIRNANNY